MTYPATSLLIDRHDKLAEPRMGTRARPQSCLSSAPSTFPSFNFRLQKSRYTANASKTSSKDTSIKDAKLPPTAPSSPFPLATFGAALTMRLSIAHAVLTTILHVSSGSAGQSGRFNRTVPTCWLSCLQGILPNCHDRGASPAILDCETDTAPQYRLLD